MSRWRQARFGSLDAQKALRANGGSTMAHGWSTTVLDAEETALSTFADLQGRRWPLRPVEVS